MKIELSFPVTTTDKELTDILNDLNRLGVPHNIQSNEWYNRVIVIELDHNLCGLVAGIKIGQMINKKRK